jgi:hypothetical protein
MAESASTLLSPQAEKKDASFDDNFLGKNGIASTAFDESAENSVSAQPGNTLSSNSTKPELKVAWGSAQAGTSMGSEKTIEKVQAAQTEGKLNDHEAAVALQHPEVLSSGPEVTLKEVERIRQLAEEEEVKQPSVGRMHGLSHTALRDVMAVRQTMITLSSHFIFSDAIRVTAVHDEWCGHCDDSD